MVTQIKRMRHGASFGKCHCSFISQAINGAVIRIQRYSWLISEQRVALNCRCLLLYFLFRVTIDSGSIGGENSTFFLIKVLNLPTIFFWRHTNTVRSNLLLSWIANTSNCSLHIWNKRLRVIVTGNKANRNTLDSCRKTWNGFISVYPLFLSPKAAMVGIPQLSISPCKNHWKNPVQEGKLKFQQNTFPCLAFIKPS